MQGDRLILVDEDDRPIGTGEELLCHSGEGILHRAFTIFLTDAAGDMLIQKRSTGKLLWPDCWETSCSGHPRVGENLVEAAAVRLAQELGFSTAMRDVGRYVYHVTYGEVGAEWEVCHLLVGNYDKEACPDEDEVAELRLVAPAVLQAEMEAGREEYAPWLEPALGLWMKVVK